MDSTVGVEAVDEELRLVMAALDEYRLDARIEKGACGLPHAPGIAHLDTRELACLGYVGRHERRAGDERIAHELEDACLRKCRSRGGDENGVEYHGHVRMRCEGVCDRLRHGGIS